MSPLKKIAAAALSAVVLAATPSAFAAEPVKAFFHAVSGELLYGTFGYTDPDGNYIPLTGQTILGARAEVEFTPDQEADIATYHMDMSVPVSGSQSQYFSVDGSNLVPMGKGKYYADLTSALYNGTIVSGRFSIEVYTDSPDGPLSLHGKLGKKTGFTFLVTAP